MLKDKLCKKKKSTDKNNKQKRKSINKIKININNSNDISNVYLSGNKKKIKLQRISTDVRTKMDKEKYNALTGTNNNRINKIRESNANIKSDNINKNKNSIRLLNKSIESHNNYTAKFRLSKMSDLNPKINNNNNNAYNNTMLLKRVNANKKDNNNPFFVPD